MELEYDDFDTEIWRRVEDFPNYLVNREGEIYSIWNKRNLIPKLRKGRPAVELKY